MQTAPQHKAQHPLAGVTAIVRFSDCDAFTSVEIIDWLDRIDQRTVEGRDTLAAEQLYLNRLEGSELKNIDEDAIVGLCKDEHGQPHILVFHQEEIDCYQGQTRFDAIMSEASS